MKGVTEVLLQLAVERAAELAGVFDWKAWMIADESACLLCCLYHATGGELARSCGGDRASIAFEQVFKAPRRVVLPCA